MDSHPPRTAVCRPLVELHSSPRGDRCPRTRVRSHYRFRNRGTESLIKPSIKWMGGRATRRCDQTLPHAPRRRSLPCVPPSGIANHRPSLSDGGRTPGLSLNPRTEGGARRAPRRWASQGQTGQAGARRCGVQCDDAFGVFGTNLPGPIGVYHSCFRKVVPILVSPNVSCRGERARVAGHLREAGDLRVRLHGGSVARVVFVQGVQHDILAGVFPRAAKQRTDPARGGGARHRQHSTGKRVKDRRWMGGGRHSTGG